MRSIRHRPPVPPALLGVAIALLAGVAHAADVSEVLDRLRAAVYPTVAVQADLVVRVVNERDETVTWWGHLWRAPDPARLRIALDGPRELAGVTLVAEQRPHDLDRFLVTLPFIRRTREIVESLRGESFLGTDFNYEDLGFERLDYQEHRLLGEDEMRGRPCWRLESVPSGSWWYGRLVRWIDVESALPLRTDYFDLGGLLVKRRVLRDVVDVDGHPTARVVEMETILAHTKTVLELSRIRYGGDLDPGLFE